MWIFSKVKSTIEVRQGVPSQELALPNAISHLKRKKKKEKLEYMMMKNLRL